MLNLTGTKSIVFAGLAMLALMSCNSPKQHDKEKDPFLTALDTHLDAIRNGDLDRLDPTVADSVIMISPNGDKMDSKAVFIDFHKNWFSMENWKWDGKIVRTQRSDSLGYALIRYEFSQQDSLGETVFKNDAYLILIFQNSKDGWQLIHDQNTNIQDLKKQ